MRRRAMAGILPVTMLLPADLATANVRAWPRWQTPDRDNSTTTRPPASALVAGRTG